MPRPEYPYKLREMHMTGNGLFKVLVDEKGKVTDVLTMQSTGHVELDAESVKALKRWRGRPGPKRDIDLPITFVR